MHVAALILGILGLILCWIPVVGWLGVLLALVSLILGIVLLVKRDDSKKTFGIVGLVLGGIAFIGGLIIQIVVALAASAAVDGVEQWQQELEDKKVQMQQRPFE